MISGINQTIHQLPGELTVAKQKGPRHEQTVHVLHSLQVSETQFDDRGQDESPSAQ
jgi:hypothetical protein